jgi:hypothetical protein
VRKVEDEKGLVERRYKEELEQQRQELAARAAELGSAAAAAEKLRRSEQDLRRQLEEKERFAAQVHTFLPVAHVKNRGLMTFRRGGNETGRLFTVHYRYLFTKAR